MHTGTTEEAAMGRLVYHEGTFSDGYGFDAGRYAMLTCGDETLWRTTFPRPVRTVSFEPNRQSTAREVREDHAERCPVCSEEVIGGGCLTKAEAARCVRTAWYA